VGSLNRAFILPNKTATTTNTTEHQHQVTDLLLSCGIVESFNIHLFLKFTLILGKPNEINSFTGDDRCMLLITPTLMDTTRQHSCQATAIVIELITNPVQWDNSPFVVATLLASGKSSTWLCMQPIQHYWLAERWIRQDWLSVDTFVLVNQ